MKNNLKISENIINNIYIKLKKEPIKGSKVNAFTFKNEKIIFDLKTAKKIQDLIMNYKIYNKIENVLTKTYRVNKLLPKILEILPKALNIEIKNHNSIINPVTKTVFKTIKNNDYNIIAKIINDNLSYAILQQIKRHFGQELDFSLIKYVELSIILGTSFLFWWFDNNFHPFIKRKDTKYSLDYYCEKNNIMFYSTDLKEWVQHRVIFVQSKKTSIKDPFFQKNKKIQNQLITKIGAHFVEYLISEKILKELPPIKNTRYLGLAKIYQEDISLASSFCKPKLDPRLSYNSMRKHINNYRFNFIQKKTFSFDPKYSYIKTKALKKCISTTDTKYCIKRPFFNLYLKYNETVNNLKFTDIISDRVSENTQIIENYIYITYQLNIAEMIASCPKDFIELLLNFMQDDTMFNTALALKFAKNYRNYNKLINEHLKKEPIIITEKNNILTGRYLEDYMDHNTENTIIKELVKNRTVAKLLWHAYNRIVSQKFFMKHFLEDAYIYQHFDYFYLDMEVTGVTRVSFNVYFLNYQSHRFSRSFIGYYTENKKIDENLFHKIKPIFSEVLTNTKNKFQDLTYSDYCKKTTEAQNEFLLNFFKDTVTIEELMKINYDSLLDLITKFVKHTKKANEALYGISLLHYMLNQNKQEYINIESIIVLDSTNSVTQHIATIFHNKSAAHFGCLIGNNYNDINALCLNGFNDFINITLKQEAIKSKEILNLPQEQYTNLTNLFETFYNHFNINQNNKVYINLEKFLNTIWDNDNKNILQNITFPEIDKDFIASFMAITKNSKSFHLNVNQNKKEYNFKLRILIIIVDYIITNIFQQEPGLSDILKSRDIIKARIMPESYGMTAKGGYQAICNAMFKKLLQNGKFNINIFHIKLFAHMISSYFSEYFKPKYLSYIEDFLKIRSYLKYRNNDDISLVMSTEYVKWTYSPRKTKTMRINVARLNKQLCPDNHTENTKSTKGLRRFINVAYPINTFDKQKIYNGLCVHAIHSQETYVMMHWLINSQKLNEFLKKQCNLDFYYTPNFDCFGTNFKHIAFLHFHIENSYYACQNDKILSSLLNIFKGDSVKMKEAREHILKMVKKPNDTEFWDGIITNKLFVKH